MHRLWKQKSFFGAGHLSDFFISNQFSNLAHIWFLVIDWCIEADLNNILLNSAYIISDSILNSSLVCSEIMHRLGKQKWSNLCQKLSLMCWCGSFLRSPLWPEVLTKKNMHFCLYAQYSDYLYIGPCQNGIWNYHFVMMESDLDILLFFL